MSTLDVDVLVEVGATASLLGMQGLVTGIVTALEKRDKAGKELDVPMAVLQGVWKYTKKDSELRKCVAKLMASKGYLAKKRVMGEIWRDVEAFVEKPWKEGGEMRRKMWGIEDEDGWLAVCGRVNW
jgi:hypothetical protein